MDSIKIRKLSKSSNLSRRHQIPQMPQKPQKLRIDSTCFTGTIQEGKEQFNLLYAGEVKINKNAKK